MSIVWHANVLPSDARRTLAALNAQAVLGPFYLAGGTRLALQLGHRTSVLFPFRNYEAIPIADPRDIAAMKLTAAASRGTKRGFVDLYVLAEKYGLDELLVVFKQKFGGADYNLVQVLKSLTYFDDADREPMPHMLRSLTWDQVKQILCPRSAAPAGPRNLAANSANAN